MKVLSPTIAKLGRITPIGTIVETNAITLPDAIASGAEDNLWTVEEGYA